MPTACVQQPGSRISLESERLVVVIPPDGDGSTRETRRDIPLRDLDRMVMGEGGHATMPALMEMMRRHIPTSFIDPDQDRLVAYRLDAGAAKRTLTAGTMVCSEKVVCYLI